MGLHVTKSNWPTAVESALQEVLQAAAACPAGSVEADVLASEAGQLRHLRDMVRDRSPEDREPLASHLIAVSVRDGLSFPADLVDLLGKVWDVYRLWRRELTWPVGERS